MNSSRIPIEQVMIKVKGTEFIPYDLRNKKQKYPPGI